jgi:hypothetical protein
VALDLNAQRIASKADAMLRSLVCRVPLGESTQKRRIPEVRRARVERTLLSAVFDLAFAFELKAHVPPSATVEERRFSAA